MIETGHFVELESIVALTHRSSQTTAGSQSNAKPRPGSTAEEDLKFVKVSEKAMARENMQTFVYSATLSKELQRNLKRFSGKPREGKKKKATTLGESIVVCAHSGTMRDWVTDAFCVYRLQTTCSRSSTSAMPTPRSSTFRPRTAWSPPFRSRRSSACPTRRSVPS